MDPLDYLFSLEKLGIKFGLGNIRTLCLSLGNPQNRFTSIIVAGTNGKGSVTAMVDEGLRQSGRRVARYTSPHLVHLEERFAINGRPVSRGQLADVAAIVRDHIERLRVDGDLPASPTFFEMTTAMAFEIFRREQVEVAVIEVGLGGRFDATNVVTPIAAAITSIDLDHEALLGDSIEAIAFEKAGVIKEGIPVVVGETKPEAVAVIEKVCAAERARLISATSGTNLTYSMHDGRATLDLVTPIARYEGVRLALGGRHQVQNALVAVRLMEELSSVGMPIETSAIRAGLGKVEWPGRLQVVNAAPGRRILLDAAHNPAGARMVAAFLGELWPDGLPIVFGAMRDKNVVGMLEHLMPHATHLVATAPRNPRAMDAEAVAAMARSIAARPAVEVCRDPVEALNRAFRYSSTIAATGSIFLVGDLLAELEPPWRTTERSV